MAKKIPPLLAALLKTVDDERLFPMSGTDDPGASKARLRDIFTELYSNASLSWDFIVLSHSDPFNPRNPRFEGVLLFEEYGELVGCGIEEFRDAIRFVADGTVVTRMDQKVVGKAVAWPNDGREFLYFMIGYMAQGYEEAIRSGRFKGGRNYRKQD